MNKIIGWVVIGQAILIIILLWQVNKQSSDLKTVQSSLTWMQNEYTEKIDEQGRQTVQNAILIGNTRKDLLGVTKGLSNLSDQQKRVVEILNKQTSAYAAIAADVRTIMKGESPVTTTVDGDGNKTYSSTVKNDWIDAKFKVGDDIFSYEIEVVNKFDFVLKEQKRPFKPTEFTLSTTNLNPYTRTTGVSSYTIVPEQKKFSFGAQGGYGLVGNSLGLYLGVGINYSLIPLF